MSAYLQITLRIKNENRAAAAAVYGKYKQPFLEENARAYLATKLFSNDVVGELKSLLEADPEVHILRRATLGFAPGPKLRLDIEAGPARGRTTAGTIRVSLHSTHKDREVAWRAFEEAVEVLAAAGYERVDSGRGALTRDRGFFRPIAAPDE